MIRKKKVVYYANDRLVRQKQPGGILFWLIYRSWLSFVFRPLLTNGFANRVAGWWAHTRLSAWRIRGFIRRHKIDTTEFADAVESYRCFNDFFIRRLRKNARPIDKSAHSLVSPADGTLFVVSPLQEHNTFYVKQHLFNLTSFVGSAQLAAPYHGGTLCLVRMAPHDYHRFHLPVAGTLTQYHTIGGKYESVNPNAYRRCLPLISNQRTVCEVTTPDNKRLLMVAVGALSVGSIVMTYNKNTNFLIKGSEVGYFDFGGSTIALIMPPNTAVIDQELITRSKQGHETAIRVGEVIGTLR